MFNGKTSSDQFFLETKLGIVTKTGDWFHTTRKDINSFAPGLLEEVPLAQLIKEAQAWVKSSGSLSLLLLYILLYFINPWLAAIVVLVFHWGWYHHKSAFIFRGADLILRILNSDVFLFLIAFLSLTFLAYAHAYTALVIGIVYFFAMKPGLLKKGWDKLNTTSGDELTLNDRVLKMVIIKQAWHENIPVSDVQKMEAQLRKIAFSRKKKGN